MSELNKRAEFEASRSCGHHYDKNEFGSYLNPFVENDYHLWLENSAAPAQELSVLPKWIDDAKGKDPFTDDLITEIIRLHVPQGGSDAARDVLAERQRQISVEGWTSERDDKYINCELARAAAVYAVCSHVEQLQICGERAWPWHIDRFKRTTYRRDLIKAGALILAEIERLDRDRAAIQAQAGEGEKA